LITEGPLVGGPNIVSNAVVVPTPGSGAYSLTLETVIVQNGGGLASTDALLYSLPPPPCNCTLTFSGPASVTNCADDAIPDVTATQICSGVSSSVPVMPVGATTNGICPQVITRNFTATDNCGTTYPFTQTVTVNCKPDCTITTSVTTAQVGDTDTAFVADAGVGAQYIWSILNGSIVSGQGTKTLTWKAGTDINSPISIMVTVVSSPAGCSSACSASVKLTPQPPKIALGGGDAATIGFWQNKNGQAIISGAANSPALANWLATQFPCLYGSLAGKPNSYIASDFVNVFKNGGSPKVGAQIMAAAFACYFTSSNLGGGSLPVKYGFNQSTGGTGTHTINVGSKGTDLGLQVNGTYTILDILNAASNWRCAHPNTPFSSAVNDLFNAINTGGDIS
jgi:hypothetical protein